MALQGLWFDGITSASLKVELSIDESKNVSVRELNSNTLVLQAPFELLKITNRIGKTPRYIYFPEGEKFETQSHEELDEWIKLHRGSNAHNILHLLESRLKFVMVAVLAMLVITWATVVYGVPAASRTIAFMLPAKVMDEAAKETLAFLDKLHLTESKLSPSIQKRVLTHFAPALTENSRYHVHVIFRHGNDIGANAFALPDGTIIFTDEIVGLAKNDDELLAVLAHEIGHVKYRHSLRAAIQGSVLSFGLVMLTGDVSTVSHLLTTLPIIIANMSYSRDFEREADDNSLVFLDAHKVERHYFVDLMERLTVHAECEHWLKEEYYQSKSETKSSASSSQAKNNDLAESSNKSSVEPLTTEDDRFNPEKHLNECTALIEKHKKDSYKFLGYFASHPETSERVAKFKSKQP